MSPAQALALEAPATPCPPWPWSPSTVGMVLEPPPGRRPHGHGGDELLPRCQKLGLGTAPPIGTMGISMGGFGALLLAEKYPATFSAVAAISPAVWTSYEQARAANAGAFASAATFDANDVVTHADALRNLPVRVASGLADPFYPGVDALAHALPDGAEVTFSNGCHTGPFFVSQEPASLEFPRVAHRFVVPRLWPVDVIGGERIAVTFIRRSRPADCVRRRVTVPVRCSDCSRRSPSGRCCSAQ